MIESLTSTEERLRTLLMALFVFGVVGIGLELVLLEHMEDVWQWVPLVLLGASLVLILGYSVSHSAALLRIFRGWMILFVLGGFIGLGLHYKGNAEFELEMYPSMKGFELFWESIKGATPALAPGNMILLGLMGLLYAYRHPNLRKPSL